ncbi:MAG: hypothetical protein A2Z96_04250 [Spirochaetes bacterium GWB1_48_6]|nr:MAG: hypothetical protein A2Z96_04250 [Spirochaetes bacterium GWB1_48_6]
MERPYYPKTILSVLQETLKRSPEHISQMTRSDEGSFVSRTFKELSDDAGAIAAGLRQLGVKPGDPVGLISDNRKEWLVTDLAILGLRAMDVPRGRDTLSSELIYILGIPECSLVVAENAEQTDKILSLKDSLTKLSHLVILDPGFDESQLKLPPGQIKIHKYAQIMEEGKQIISKDPLFWERAINEVLPEDVATLIFTSGTTGEPKGVMLTHKNFCFQLKEVHKVIDIQPGDVWLSVLPVWHVFERIAQYIALYTSSSLAYSKPIGKILLQDFLSVRPMWMASVPRIWEALRVGIKKNAQDQGGAVALIFRFFESLGSLYAGLKARAQGRYPHFSYHFRLGEILWTFLPLILLYPLNALGDLLVFSKIRSRLGGRFKAGISGGGTLGEDVDLFFAATGIKLLNGYGLTETAPVIAIRNYFNPVLFTLEPLPDTQIQIINEEGKPCGPGEKGLIQVRGGQIMKGYYKNPKATETILDSSGWLNTGDLGMWTTGGQFVIRGRAKDTIVLSGGENVEPGPIETRLRESSFIEQALVVGQDQKFLGVLIQPDFNTVEIYLKQNNIPYIDRTHVCELPEVQELINEEIASRINGKTGFRPFERIVRFALIEKPFTLGEELSAKQEVKRHVITQMYEKKILKMYKKGDD